MVYPGFWDEYEERKDEYVPPGITQTKSKSGLAVYESRVVTAVRDRGLAPSRRLANIYIKQNGGYSSVGLSLGINKE